PSACLSPSNRCSLSIGYCARRPVAAGVPQLCCRSRQDDRLDQPRNRVLVCLHIRPEFQLAQGGGGNRADGRESDPCELWRSVRSRSGAPTPDRSQQGYEVLDGGGTGEGDYIRTTIVVLQRSAQAGARGLWNHGFIGFHYVHLSSGSAQLARDHI